jgi:hypothetical protein
VPAHDQLLLLPLLPELLQLHYGLPQLLLLPLPAGAAALVLPELLCL